MSHVTPDKDSGNPVAREILPRRFGPLHERQNHTLPRHRRTSFAGLRHATKAGLARKRRATKRYARDPENVRFRAKRILLQPHPSITLSSLSLSLSLPRCLLLIADLSLWLIDSRFEGEGPKQTQPFLAAYVRTAISFSLYFTGLLHMVVGIYVETHASWCARAKASSHFNVYPRKRPAKACSRWNPTSSLVYMSWIHMIYLDEIRRFDK